MKKNLLLLFIFLGPLLSAQTFVETTCVLFANISTTSVALTDVDGDGDQDALVIGLDPVTTNLI